MMMAYPMTTVAQCPVCRLHSYSPVGGGGVVGGRGGGGSGGGGGMQHAARWLCSICGHQGAAPSPSALASAPGATLLPTQPPAQPPSPTGQATALLEALRADARLYGEEIADALGRLTPHEARRMTLAQVWDRMQQAQDTLYTALGERRMGDYPPDIEQVTRALVEVGVWHIVALGVVERLNGSDGDGEEEGGAQ